MRKNFKHYCLSELIASKKLQSVYLAHDSSNISQKVILTAVRWIMPPHWMNTTAQQLLRDEHDLELVDRWWLLDALAAKQCALQLYSSRWEAEQALRAGPADDRAVISGLEATQNL